MKFRVITIWLVLLGFANVVQAADEVAIVVGSKNFNESYLLAEIMSQRLEVAGFAVERRFGLGGTLVCYGALLEGEIDLYAEYTGTLSQVILKKSDLKAGVDSLDRDVGELGLSVLPSFGFNNTYAMALKKHVAEARGLVKISDLGAHPDLVKAFSLEFLNREDGWPGLAQTYSFEDQPTGIDHGLAYQAIDDGKIDITDAYSTDGDLERYQLTVLEDDRGYFPQYLAVPFVRSDLPADARAAILDLVGQIDDDTMRALNAEVVVKGKSFAEVAGEYLRREGFDAERASTGLPWESLLHNTIIHLQLTVIALSFGVLVGMPLGVVVYRSERLSRIVVYIAGLMQTVPSIALLALMIPLFGIGFLPAVIALFLYSLLPILRNTITGLISIDPLLKRIAEAVGLTRIQQLRYILVPLALPTILAGIKTAAVISIGTATLAAFIGAGGLGEPIVTGLALNDTSLILQGAIPAACLAIVVELLFDGLEKLLVKEHLRRGEIPSG